MRAHPVFERADIEALLRFLIANEYVAFVDDLTPFVPVADAWDAPCAIANAIIDVDAQHHDYPKLIAELDRLGCEHLQVRSYSHLFGAAELVALVALCDGTSIQTVQAIIPYDPATSDGAYAALVTSHRILVGLVLHSADQDRHLRVDYGARGRSAEYVAVEIELTTKRLTSELDCGSITTKELLRPSRPTFSELRHFNGCLNRKISVDKRGELRSCPAMATSFGHHRSIALHDVVLDERFRRAARARKDEIQVCRDCPYRDACTDCRAFLAEPDADDSKPLKCGYDPYTDTWSDWRAQPRAAAALETYRKRCYLPVLRG